MKFRALALLAWLVPATLGAQSFRNLPDWAIPVFAASSSAPKPPRDTDYWVLLDRTEFAYTGSGEIATHHYRLVEVLTERGIGQGQYLLSGLGGRASKVKKLKGWNLRPDGEMVKLDRDNVVAVENIGDSGGVSNDRWTGAILDRVVSGSIVAFEAVQVETSPCGPALMAYVLESAPIFRWEVSAATRGGWFTSLKQVSMRLEPRHFNPWIPSPQIVPGVSISASNLPPLPEHESATPAGWDALPRVELTFLDPDLKEMPSAASWDGVASWEEGKFKEAATPAKLPGVEARPGLDGLQAIHGWMRTNLVYKQVYLAPDRGWVPSPSGEVLRRRYGDCKDLTGCFLAAARAAGLEAFPVLARVYDGRIEPDEPVSPACFNHVIVAVRLTASLGLPSEVEAPQGRFLLVDPTARFTQLGKLPVAHVKGRLMICANGKAIWVQAPDGAIDQPRVEVTLSADTEENGRLKGTLHVKESANARNLRLESLMLDPLAFQRSVSSTFLNLPADATVKVLRHGDPLDLEKPFEVELSLDHPKGFTRHGGEWDLDGMGVFRMVPQLIQKSGHPRVYPVEYNAPEALEVQADITVPASLVPVLPKREVGTPFLKASWGAEAQPTQKGGTRLSIRFSREHAYAYFGFKDREAGVSEWNKGRRLMQGLAEDALAFGPKKAP